MAMISCIFVGDPAMTQTEIIPTAEQFVQTVCCQVTMDVGTNTEVSTVFYKSNHHLDLLQSVTFALYCVVGTAN